VKLRQDKFKTPQDLCNWVNDNALSITVVGVCNNEFMEYVLFYTAEGEVIRENKPEFDAEEIWQNRMNRRGGIDGSKKED